MASKFTEFLKEHKIDERRLLNASKRLERLRPEDRAMRMQKSKGEDAKGGDEDGEKAELQKPRSGRPVTRRLLNAANAGSPIPGPAKTRLLRAVNSILEQKKQDQVDLRALF